MSDPTPHGNEAPAPLIHWERWEAAAAAHVRVALHSTEEIFRAYDEGRDLATLEGDVLIDGWDITWFRSRWLAGDTTSEAIWPMAAVLSRWRKTGTFPTLPVDKNTWPGFNENAHARIRRFILWHEQVTERA